MSKTMYEWRELAEKHWSEIEKAIEYFEKAAELGDTWSMNRLGQIFFEKYRDFDKAVYWYKMSADKGDSYASYELGLVYHEMKNDVAALEWLKKAYELGDYQGAFEIGKIFQYGDNDIPADSQRAIEWFEKFIHSKNIVQVEIGDGLTHIGEIYFYGQGTERDYFKAERYFLTAVEHYAKAALPNDGQAYYYLGLIYYFGHCGKKNISQAVEYLNKSITFGNEYAMHRLAGIYLDKEVDDVSGEEIVKLLEQTDDWDILPRCIFTATLLKEM